MTIRFDTEAEYEAFLERRGGSGARPSKPANPDEPFADDAVAFHCKMLGLPVPVRELRFDPPRRNAFDWAWPTLMIALEKEGVVYPKPGLGDYKLGGRHTSVTGFHNDIDKYSRAFRLGWTVLRCLPKHIDSGEAVQWIHERVTREIG